MGSPTLSVSSSGSRSIASSTASASGPVTPRPASSAKAGTAASVSNGASRPAVSVFMSCLSLVYGKRDRQGRHFFSGRGGRPRLAVVRPVMAMRIVEQAHAATLDALLAGHLDRAQRLHHE